MHCDLSTSYSAHISLLVSEVDASIEHVDLVESEMDDGTDLDKAKKELEPFVEMAEPIPEGKSLEERVDRLVENVEVLKHKDKDGNTPLHLATINCHPKVVSSLIWDKRVDLGLVNFEGLTAIDSAEEKMEAITSYRQRLTWMPLKSAGTEKAKLQNKPKLERVKSAKNEPYNMDYSKDRVNTLLLVSTLVATVTFAAGFTIPGIISLACLLSLFIPLNLPYTSTFTILRYISYYPFCLLMLASGSYYDPVEHDLY